MELGASLGEIIFIVQPTINAACDSRRHCTFDGSCMAAHQNHESELGMILIRVRSKPAEA
jgi:hypothetical protein